MFYEIINTYNIFAIITGLLGVSVVLIGLLAPIVFGIWDFIWAYMDDFESQTENWWLTLFDKVVGNDKEPPLSEYYSIHERDSSRGKYHVKYKGKFIYSSKQHYSSFPDYDTAHSSEEDAKAFIKTITPSDLRYLDLEVPGSKITPYSVVLFLLAVGFAVLTLLLEFAFTPTLIIASTYGSLVLARSVRRLQKKTKTILADLKDHKSKSAEEAHGASKEGEV